MNEFDATMIENDGSFTPAMTETVNVEIDETDFDELSNRPSYAGTTMTHATSIPTVPTKTSDLTNDSGFLTSHQDISGKVNYTDKLSQLTGSMSDAEKVTVWSRLTSIKTTMDSVAVAGARYFLGTQTAVSITMPSDASVGQEISVCFYSGSTATTLTVSGTTIGTIPTPSANQRVELSMVWDGSYWAVLSNVMAVTV